MVSIIARSSESAKPGLARKKTAPAQPPAREGAALCQNVARDLALEAANAIWHLVFAVDRHEDGSPRCDNAHLRKSNSLLGQLIDPSGYAEERGLEDPEPGDTLGFLTRIAKELRLAQTEVNAAGIGGTSAGESIYRMVLVQSASSIAQRLTEAYNGLPGTIKQLRALAKYQGAMEMAVKGHSSGHAAPTQDSESFGHIAALLKQAACTDEPHARSGDSDRLLRIGGEIAAQAAAFMSEDDREDIAFDIAACVSASSRVPGDTQSPKRAEFIRVAGEFLAVLAGTPITDILDAGLPPRQTDSTEADPLMPLLNLSQLHRVLEHVARNASTLNQLLLEAQATSDEAPLAVLIDGAQALAEKIGGMADDAIDGNVVGGYDRWFYGPNFGRRGNGATV